MKQDFRNVKNAYALIPNGWYKVKIINVKIDSTQKNNYELWNLEMNIIENNEYYGQPIWDNIIFMDKLAPRNKEIFRVLGYDVDNQELNIEPNDLLNKRFKVLIIENEYEKDGVKKKNNKVDFFNGYKELENKDDNSDIPF